MTIIYFCNEISRRNGWGVINYYTVQQAIGAGHNVIVFTGRNAVNENINGAKVYPILFSIGRLRDHWLLNLKSFFQIRRIIKRERADVIHVLVEPYLIYFAILSQSRLVLTIVGTYAISIFQNSSLRLLYHHALKKVSQIVSISAYTAKRFREEVGYQSEIIVSTLGVDISQSSRAVDVSQSKRELSYSFVGHIKPRKGLIYALRAMSSVVKSYPEAKFYVAGLFEDRSYSDMCLKYVSDNGLSENVKFLGRMPHSEVHSIYSRGIMNLLPSYNSKEGSFEGFGLIHLEANAASTLTLGSRESGNESAIIDGVTGFLVQQEDENDLAEKMLKVAEIFRRGEYEKYAENCLKYAKENSWEKYFKQLEQRYLEMIK